MPYGQEYSGGSYGGGQGLGAIGGGLSAGLRNAIQYKREKQQAEKEDRAAAWMQDKNNPENQLRMAQVAALNNTKNSTIDGGMLDPKLTGTRLPIDQALPYLLGKIGVNKGSAIGADGKVKLSTEDQKKVGEITQALGNIQQFADVGSKTGMWKSGLGNVANEAADMLYKVPFLAHNSVIQNQTPDSAAFNSSKKEAAMRLATALFGQRATADKIAEVENLLPGEGLNPKLANQKMNEALNSFRVMANGLVQEKNAAGDQAGGAALEKNLADIFGNFKIKMPEDSMISSPGAPGIKTTFDAANYEGAAPASIAAASAAQAPAAAVSAPVSAPPAPGKAPAFDPAAFAAQVIARRAALKAPAAQKAPGGI